MIAEGDREHSRGAQLLVTYVNVDEAIDLYGSDVSATALLGNEWELSGSVSFVNENLWETQNAGLVDAPRWKGGVALNYDNDDTGLFGLVRMRYNDAFPVNSGVYLSTHCLNEPDDQPSHRAHQVRVLMR